MVNSTDVVVVGGCGRVGLPLGLAFASRGRSVVRYDIDADAVERVNTGRMPLAEDGARAEMLLGTSHFDLGRFLPGYLRWYLSAYGLRRRSRRLPALARTGAAYRG